MNTKCSKCNNSFTIYDEDLVFLERISPTFSGNSFSIPPPRECPSCREALRMAFRNEVQLFVRKCDRTGERLISMYPSDAGFPVYRHREWFKDENDSTVFGREYDQKRSIFEQLAEIQTLAPRFHVYNFQEELDVNSQYTNCAGENKNCYLIFASGRNEQCLFGRYVNYCFNCVDTFFADKCRSCYESCDLGNCERVFFSNQCKDCSDSWFLYDCRGCHDCIGCAGLRQKSYCIFNEQLTREKYEAKKIELNLNSRSGIENVRATFLGNVAKSPRRALHGELNDSSVGDYIWSTKNCFHCFDSRNAEDCRYCTFFMDGKDSMDVYSWGEMELCYQISGGGSYGEYRSAFTAMSFGCKESYYLDHCTFCDHCFACVGLNRKSYCILNKQYSKTEYEKVVASIVTDMIKGKEWGEFFPASLAPIGYNHSVAQDFYPLNKEAAIESGFRWSDFKSPPPQSKKIVEAKDLPDEFSSSDPEILDSVIRCASTGKLFKLVKAELDFYSEYNLPLPQLHPEERQKLRQQSRNPRKIRQCDCAECGQSIPTTFVTDKQLQILCDKCYQNNMHG